MEAAAIMAIIGLVSTIINVGVTAHQQNKEFQQQQQLLQMQQDYQSGREDLLFQRNSIPEQYKQMIDAGFNPNLAAASLLGGNSNSAASSDSSSSAPSTNSAISALSSMIGQGGQNLYDILRNSAEIQNIESNTNKTDIEAGIMPRDFQLRSMSTSAQIRAWNESANLASKQANYNEEMTNLVRQQRIYYGRLTEAQIEAYKAQVLQAVASASNQFAQAETEQHRQSNLDASTGVLVAQEENVRQNTILQSNESNEALYRADRERIAKEFEERLGGVPLSADARSVVTDWAIQGEYDKIQTFFMTIFTSAESQQLGNTLGSPRLKLGLPFGLLNYENQRGPLNNVYHNPLWNPHLGASSFW